MSAQRLQRAIEQQSQRPAGQHQRDHECGQSQALAQQIGEHRAVLAEKIMRPGIDRRVQRRVLRVVRNERGRDQKSRQQQAEPQRLEQPPLQRRPSAPSRRAGGVPRRPRSNRSIWPCFPRCRPIPKPCAVPCGTRRIRAKTARQHILPAGERQSVEARAAVASSETMRRYASHRYVNVSPVAIARCQGMRRFFSALCCRLRALAAALPCGNPSPQFRAPAAAGLWSAALPSGNRRAFAGAARGAAGGALFGAIGGNAGRGAAIGAAVGGVAGAARRGAARSSGACY